MCALLTFVITGILPIIVLLFSADMIHLRVILCGPVFIVYLRQD
jgi:hypothetical protein